MKLKDAMEQGNFTNDTNTVLKKEIKWVKRKEDLKF